MMTPTHEQNMIINDKSSCAVIAQPGSGKTFTLAYKIREILNELPEYKGVIAISYTNKASDELKKRCIGDGLNKKGSFFGTIDKFYISEIVLSFGLHIFGNPKKEIEIVKDLDESLENDIKREILDNGYDNLTKKHVEWLKEKFINGIVMLETVGILSLYIFDNSLACRRYLKAKYSYVIIDEYQDSGKEQHELFERLHELGLHAVAVGDINQSIYAFSGKDPRFLMMLAQTYEKFSTYALSKNHRCHKSIINYSMRLLTPKYEILEKDEVRVFEKHIEGTEIDICKWIEEAILYATQKFGILELNKVGILVRGNRTGRIIDNNLKVPHKLFINTPLDEDSSLWGTLFKKILYVIFDTSITKYEILEEYLDVDIYPAKAKQAIELINQISEKASQDKSQLIRCVDDFIKIGNILLSESLNNNTLNILKAVLSADEMLDSFRPASSKEVQIMTLHKSKGLEFEIVFHLDLYKWILPQYQGDFIQDLNLHYVGITRARQCCVLCTSSQRHNASLNIVSAEKSEFLTINGLESLRKDWDFNLSQTGSEGSKNNAIG